MGFELGFEEKGEDGERGVKCLKRIEDRVRAPCLVLPMGNMKTNEFCNDNHFTFLQG